MDFLFRLLDTEGFPPRWRCGAAWAEDRALGWVHVVSDVLTWLAYLTIPLVLAYFVRKRKGDVVFPKIFWLFSAFIFACGTVHLLEAVIFWVPLYRLSAVAKSATAVVSVATVIALVRTAPEAITIPGLTKLNHQLKKQVEDRKAAQESLRESHAQLQESEYRMRQTFETSPNGLVVVDGDRKIIAVNAMMTEIFGYSDEELLGQPIERLIPIRFQRDDAGDRNGHVLNAQTRLTGAERELAGIRSDGTEFPVDIGLTPMDEASDIVMATINDISVRKQHERVVEQKNEQLNRLNTELLEFAYSTSHDLKAPLASITGLLRFCADDLDEGDLNEVHANIQKARELAERLANRVESTLTLAKSDMESGKLEPIDIKKRVMDAWEALPHDGVSLETSFEHTAPLQSVSIRFDTVLENLLSNAVKYQDPEQLDKAIRISTWTRNDRFFLAVEDNGIGIPQEYHDKVFDYSIA